MTRSLFIVALLVLVAACGGKSDGPTNTRSSSDRDAGAKKGESSRVQREDASVAPVAEGEDGAPGDEPAGEATDPAPEGSTPAPSNDPVPHDDAPTPAVADAAAAAEGSPAGPVQLGPVGCGLPYFPDLTADQIAESLAFSLWGAVPDEALLEAAKDGAFSSPQDGEKEVERMLQDPRTWEHLSEFGLWWFGNVLGEPPTLHKDPEKFPEYDAELEALMRRETELFSHSVVSEPGATLDTLLSAPYTFANARLGQLYDLELSSDDMERVELDPALRAGLFTQPYFLSFTTIDESNPARRGFFLRERLLCTPLPPPPIDLTTESSPASEQGITTREWYEGTLSEPECTACHLYGTWMGFGFEHYDALGRYRTEENGHPIDASVELWMPGEPDPVLFSDATSMMRAFGTRPEAQACFVQHWLTFLLGRPASDATGPLVEYVLQDGVCGFSPGGEVPCVEQVTIPSYAEQVRQCALEQNGSLSVRKVILTLVSSNLLVGRTFACGERRCLVDLELCQQRVSSGDAGANDEFNCLAYSAGETGCDVAVAEQQDCKCEPTGSGATVTCQD